MFGLLRRIMAVALVLAVSACKGPPPEGRSHEPTKPARPRSTSTKPANYALWFDGNDDYLRTDKWLSGSPGGFCIEAWVKPAPMNPYWNHVSLFAHRAAGNDKFLRYDWRKRDFSFAAATPDNRVIVVRGRPKPNETGWHHLALVCDGGSVTLYLDGREAGRTSTTAASDWDSGYRASFLGGDPLPGTRVRGSFRGQIDEVRIWSKPRSVEEIRTAMNRPVAPNAPGLAAYWNFDEGGGQIAHDLTGHGHDAKFGSAELADPNDPRWVRSDRPGSGLSTASTAGHTLWFNGQGAFVRTVPLANLGMETKAATVEAWIRPGAPVRPSCMIAIGNTPADCEFRLGLGAGGTVAVAVRTTKGVRNFQTAAAVRANTWHHVAVRWDSSAASVFVDGKNVFRQALDAPPVWSAQALLAGAEAGGADPFLGEIDELRVWNLARTAEQIAAAMNRDVPGSEPGLVGYWRFDEGDGQVVADASAHAAHGQLGDVPLPDMHDPVWLVSDLPLGVGASGKRPVAPARGGALYFDGKDDYVELGNAPELRLTGAMTIEAWVKPEVITPEQPILTKENVAGKQNAYGLLLRGGKPVFRVSDGSAGCCGDQGWFPAEGRNPVRAREWHHVAGVYDGKNVAVYLDGVLENTVALGKPVADIPFSVKIGTNALVQKRQRVFRGEIDEVRIWNLARKQADILASMNAGLRGDEPGLVGYWTFDEIAEAAASSATLPIAFDRSGHNNHGFLGGSLLENARTPKRVVSDAPVMPAPTAPEEGK